MSPRAERQVHLVVLGELDQARVAVPPQVIDMPAGVDAARDDHLLGHVVAVVARAVHRGVSVPAWLAVHLCHVDFTARRPAHLAIVVTDHPSGGPAAGSTVNLNPCLEAAVAAGEQTMSQQARGRVAPVPATRGERLDDQVPLPVQVTVGTAVGVGLQFIVVGPSAEIVGPFDGSGAAPFGPLIKLILKNIRHHAPFICGKLGGGGQP